MEAVVAKACMEVVDARARDGRVEVFVASLPFSERCAHVLANMTANVDLEGVFFFYMSFFRSYLCEPPKPA